MIVEREREREQSIYKIRNEKVDRNTDIEDVGEL